MRKSSLFARPHVNEKPAYSKVSILGAFFETLLSSNACTRKTRLWITCAGILHQYTKHKYGNCIMTWHFFSDCRASFSYTNVRVQFTSIHASFVVKSVWIGNKILRSGFFGSITEFAHVGRDNPIETLASLVLTTDQYAFKPEISHRCPVHMSLQFPAEDG